MSCLTITDWAKCSEGDVVQPRRRGAERRHLSEPVSYLSLPHRWERQIFEDFTYFTVLVNTDEPERLFRPKLTERGQPLLPLRESSCCYHNTDRLTGVPAPIVFLCFGGYRCRRFRDVGEELRRDAKALYAKAQIDGLPHHGRADPALGFLAFTRPLPALVVLSEATGPGREACHARHQARPSAVVHRLQPEREGGCGFPGAAMRYQTPRSLKM